MSCLSLAMRHSAILVLMSILLSFELFHDVFVFEMLCKIGKVGIALVFRPGATPLTRLSARIWYVALFLCYVSV